MNKLKDLLSQEEAVSILANYILDAHERRRSARSSVEAVQEFAKDQERKVNDLADAAVAALVMAERNVRQRADMQLQATRRAKKAAEKRHGQPGGSREKREKIRAVWSSGKYSSKDLCAEQECAGLEMSFSSARRALRGAPNPS
ncbi:hypothetical protein [Curvibacter sp. PAE-UM]|uniref:hypothetical protein n=1 Tax=Curvibacter sp. PAE-UM TaxID=1714344 RepID=UPI0012E3F627|nr:hypothetical protein [Curvibacter sp. PAE-UM]